MATLICGFTFIRQYHLSVLGGGALFIQEMSIINNGETNYNRKGILQGQAIDSPLSDTGGKQADAAGLYLKDVKFNHVYVSDMLRARQTADCIWKQNCSCSALQMNCDSLLKERSFGIAEGQQMKDVKELAAAAGQSFPDFTPAGGETREQVKERFKLFWEKSIQEIGSEHWDTKAKQGSPSALPPAPAEGKPDDGLQHVPVHVLVVTHGAYMREVAIYLTDELNCSIPKGLDKSHMLSLSPNTGLCRFLVSLEKENECFRQTQTHCVFMHRIDHLKLLKD